MPNPETTKPEGLDYDPEDNFHYFLDPTGFRPGPLVIFPCSYEGLVVLDGAFTPKQLRDVAAWVDANAAPPENESSDETCPL